ncbi:hypothetical protein HPP92_008700 [Vanilla planifolia]|uniref:HpcH/HpaI aldolase/citrate lyase domain-containing protein n=1 Tax=Vanilla planifolia TaxID=51239 RepID=A0A835R6V4_VANPL|nr:hypothetical protein HPP92_008886 [Vanilla planifolia]KAG0486605.1 hypothetical protein HPP92_008700 [Vanilla planifolia]
MAMMASSTYIAAGSKPRCLLAKSLVKANLQNAPSFALRNTRNPKSKTAIPISNSPPRLAPSISSSSLAHRVASPIAPNSTNLKSRLAAGETLYGLFLLSASPTLAEIAGLSGYDYVVVDMEHGPGGIADALPCLRALSGTGAAAILRVPETSAPWAKKALDLGPQGIMFPMIDDARIAELAVSYCRFPPRGVRGSAHTVVRASAYGIDDGYVDRCEEDLLVMCQVESVAAVSEIEAIAAVEGVDCLQMGPLDLSASMGYLWDPGHKKVRAVLRDAERRVLAAKRSDAAAEGGFAAGKTSGPYLSGFAMPHDRPEDLKLRGYHMVAGAVDVGMFRKAAVEDVLRFRQVETQIGEEDGDDENANDKSYWSE